MCIIFIYTNGKPSSNGYKLILISNRDEYYVRPAAVAAEWKGYKNVFGGLDMEPGREGGTWLAISGIEGTIKAAALLNIPGEERHANSHGRGPIVADYVTGTESNEKYCKRLMQNPYYYNAFTLVTVEITNDASTVIHCSNAPPETKVWSECTSLGFGNSPPHSELEKVKHGKLLFEQIVKKYENDKSKLIEKCVELLKDQTKYWPDNELSTRNGVKMGEQLSSICVRSNSGDYGSRTRTVILVDGKNHMDFYEETMMSSDPNGEWEKTHISRQL